MKCYWGHTSDPSLMRTCTDGKNPVCPICCHNHCYKEYAGMYTACAQRGWPVWPPQAAGMSAPRAAEALCYWKHTNNKSLMRVCTDGSNPVCPVCCHQHCPTSYPDMYKACRSRNFPVWPPQAVQQMAQGGYPAVQPPPGYGAPQQYGYAQPQQYGAPQQYGYQAPQPTVKCYWGHTTDRSKMKTCTDGSNPVCPECCHKHCITQYASMYNSCKANGWPVWPPSGGQYIQAQSQAPYGSQPAPAVTCYWGHTSDPSRLRTCTDGKNPVCPECCHKHCPGEYPGMYSACEKRNWPVWPPQAAGLSGAQPVQCYWHHTNDRSKLKTCTDGSNPVCPECCHVNCPQQYPGMYQECARKNWPVWLPQSHGPAATADIQCYWHHTTDRLSMKTCADGSSLVCPDCCHVSCPTDTPDWQMRCRAAGFPVWPQGSRLSAQPARRPAAVSQSVSQSSGSGFLIAPAKLQEWPWDVEILQDGFVVSSPSGVACVRRRPFTIRLRMPAPRTVRINTHDTDANFKLVQPGARVDANKSFTPRPGGLSGQHCFSAGTGTVDADVFLTRLVVSDGGHQEITFRSYNDHRWSKVDVTDQRAIFERRIQNIRLTAQGYDEPVERFRGAKLYMTVLVKHHDDGEIRDDELRHMVIEFQ